MKKNLLLTAVCFVFLNAHAQWNTDVTTNTAICSTAPSQAARTSTVVTTDLTGAMYIAWIDSRTTANGSIYMQKADLTNSKIFAENGVLVATSATSISNLSITPDLVGGAIVAWQTNNDIFAQRISAAGTPVWANPIPLSVSTALNQTAPQITLVNATEAMVVFSDNRNGNIDLYLNKIAVATGNLLLTIDTPVCKATGTQNQFSVIPDLNGGAYISWSDGRTTGNINLYALRVKNDGLPSTGWTADGTLICDATGTQSNSVIVPDLAGGVYIAWEDFRAGNTDVYAQRVTAAGTIVWDANGMVVANPTGNQQGPQASPVNDGVIITWTDARLSTSNRDIFAQKLTNTTGAAAWAENGVVICDAPANQPSATTNGLRIVPDNANGAIIVWNDLRNTATSGNDLYAQRINNSGTVQWTANGIVISSATGNQGPDIGVIPITASNGAYIVWQDSRSGTTNGEIYGAVVTGTGNLTSSVRDRILLEGKISAYPVPTQNQITVSLSKIKPGNYIVQVIDVSGRIMLQNKTSVNGSEGTIVTDVQSLQRGNYYLRLTHESSKAETLLKFTKQ